MRTFPRGLLDLATTFRRRAKSWLSLGANQEAQWDIPAERMKMKQPHRVYLARQAVELLTLLKSVGPAEPQAYVFASILRGSVPLGEATLNHFFKRLDFGVPDFSPHGTRGTAATLLREHGFSRDVVELLAHAERNKIAAAYHHHELAEERRRALQYLADQIDRLSAARTVVASTDMAIANSTAVATP